jgi:hypothetical protein
VDVVAGSFCFVVVLAALQVHKIQLIDQTELLQHGKGPVNGDPVQSGVLSFGSLPEGERVQVTVSALDDLRQETALVGHPHSARNQFLFERTT